MKTIRNIIIKKYLAGSTGAQIFKALKNTEISRAFVYKVITRYKETGTNADRQRSGRPRSVRTPQAIKVVRERIRRNPERSGRKLASELGMSKTSMQLLLKSDLKMRAYKKSKVHGLTASTIAKRKKRSEHILQWHEGDEFIFSDEKLFVLEQSLNSQNDRIYSISFQDLPDDRKYVKRFQKPSSVMVWGAISKRGLLPLKFVDPGVKINAEYYKTEILEEILLPALDEMYGEDYYVFTQDGAPAHTANIVQEWCKENFTDFLSKDEWPPSSPDCNPLDYFVWSYMLSELNTYKINNLTQLKAAILKTWGKLPMEKVRAACSSFEKRLKLVKRQKGAIIKSFL